MQPNTHFPSSKRSRILRLLLSFQFPALLPILILNDLELPPGNEGGGMGNPGYLCPEQIFLLPLEEGVCNQSFIQVPAEHVFEHSGEFEVDGGYVWELGPCPAHRICHPVGELVDPCPL